MTLHWPRVLFLSGIQATSLEAWLASEGHAVLGLALGLLIVVAVALIALREKRQMQQLIASGITIRSEDWDRRWLVRRV